MYLDEKNSWTPIEPERPRRSLTDREEKMLLWSIAAFVVTLVIAPIGGATVIEAFLAVLGL
ncbi:hypothetical protein [Jiella sonneratiae]|uniref:Uncharacterized protein n=1 Tax=Jiella sonneratiae TaxID=2816856 RepID=A0ABS3J9A3_9HYPH|nr:hypothetical protein [Jiella sonneratiae]MBO0906256.1 hypothetical protein [Jiella sonneratiae]